MVKEHLSLSVRSTYSQRQTNSALKLSSLQSLFGMIRVKEDVLPLIFWSWLRLFMCQVVGVNRENKKCRGMNSDEGQTSGAKTKFIKENWILIRKARVDARIEIFRPDMLWDDVNLRLKPSHSRPKGRKTPICSGTVVSQKRSQFTVLNSPFWLIELRFPLWFGG